MDEFFWLQIGQKRKRFQFDCSIIRCNDLVNRKSRAGPSLLSLPRRGAIASSTSFGRVWQGWGNALVCWLPSLSANTSTPSYIYIYTYLKGWQNNQNINEFKQFRLTPGCISLRTSHCWIARLWCEEFGGNCSCSAKTSTVAHTPRLHFLGSTSTEKGQDDNDPSIAYRRQVAMRPNDSYDHIWYD